MLYLKDLEVNTTTETELVFLRKTGDRSLRMPFRGDDEMDRKTAPRCRTPKEIAEVPKENCSTLIYLSRAILNLGISGNQPWLEDSARVPRGFSVLPPHRRPGAI